MPPADLPPTPDALGDSTPDVPADVPPDLPPDDLPPTPDALGDSTPDVPADVPRDLAPGDLPPTPDALGDSTPDGPPADLPPGDVPPADLPPTPDALGDSTPDVPADVPRDLAPGDLPPTPDALGDSTPDATPDADVPPYVPPFDPTVCGAVPHAWLPPRAVGAVVAWQEHALSNLTPAFIDGLLAEADFTAVTPVPYGARNFLLRYTTQDHGQVREATAVVGVPQGIDPAGPLPIALWLHGTTGFMDDCAPSRDPLEAIVAPTLLASQGYLAVAPDYLGLLGFGAGSPPGSIHPYLSGEATAIASLDAVRAALRAVAADPELATPAADPQRLVLLGGSQGGHAAFFVDRYAPHYAPEFHIVAAAALVAPTDLIGQATWGANHFGPTGLTLAAALTALRAWYGLPADMTPALTNEEPYFVAETLPELMATVCGVDDDRFDGITTLEQIYTPWFLEHARAGDFAELDPWGCFFAENSLGRTSVPRASDTPFLAAYGELDDLVITAVEREAIPALCAAGYRIEYFECAALGHTDGAVAAVPYALRWLAAELAGLPSTKPLCQITPPEDCALRR